MSRGEREARYAAVAAYIRAAEAAWVASEHARSAESQAHHRIDRDCAAIERGIGGLRRLHFGLRDAARASGIDPARLGEVPQPVRVTLAPRESVTQVNLEGLEQAVERPPVQGLEIDALRRRLADLHDRLTHTDAAAAERETLVDDLYQRALELEAAERREADLTSEAEWADSHVEQARERERSAIDQVREASDDYAAAVREWCNALRAAAPDDVDIEGALDALEQRVEPPLDEDLRVLSADLPETVLHEAHAVVEPLLAQVRHTRDAALSEEHDLAAELAELAERRADETAPVTASSGLATALGTPTPAFPSTRGRLRRPSLPEERAGLEAALEASGLLVGLITPEGTVVDHDTRDLLLSPTAALSGRTLADALVPVEDESVKVDRAAVTALLSSIRLLGDEESPRHPETDRPGSSPLTRLPEQRTTSPRRALAARRRLGTPPQGHRRIHRGEARAQALERLGQS